MPKSRKRPTAKAKTTIRRRPTTGEDRSPWTTIPRATYGQERPAPPPGREWPAFDESPWFTWTVLSELPDATPEERAELGLSPDGLTPEGLTPDALLALIEISPWRIAPGWADTPLTDRRAEWTSLAAEATQTGNAVADLVAELVGLEERGLLKWDREPQTALLAANLAEALSYLNQLPAADPQEARDPQAAVTAPADSLLAAGVLPSEEVTGAAARADGPVRRILLPIRDDEGHPSAAWLLMQAAQLAIETASVLRAINGIEMNLAEEISVQSEVAALLANAAHARAIMESRMPLAVAWTDSLPRARTIFARAREAGSDPGSVAPAFTFPPMPPVPPEILSQLAQATRDDPDPEALCAGITKQGLPCARTIFKGIGSRHCHSHFTAAEQRRRDLLQEARARTQNAEAEASNAQRWLQAEWWVRRYG